MNSLAKAYNLRPENLAKVSSQTPENKLKAKEWRDRDENKESRKEYDAIYRKNPVNKERVKRWTDRPENKARRNETARRPENRAKRINYGQKYRAKPENQAKAKDYNSNPENKLKAKEWRDRPENRVRRDERACRPENKARRNETARRPENRAKKRAYDAIYRGNSENLVSEKAKAYRDSIRFNVLATYSKLLSNSDVPCCNCCKLNTHLDFLAIDHIAGKKEMDSEPELIKLGYSSELKSTTLLKFIIKNNFPKGFQILCTCCNFAKGMEKNNNKCPHEMK